VKETINWMVLETGSWLTDEDTAFQAGVVEIEGDMRLTGRQFQKVRFWNSFSSVPVVLTTINSFVGFDWVKSRQQQGDSTYFMLAMEEKGSALAPTTGDLDGDTGTGTQSHADVEKVGWAAFEPSRGNIGTRNFEARFTPGVTHKHHTIKFGVSFSSAPRIFAGMQTYAGTDSAQLRQSVAGTKTDFTVHVEEETCTDKEMTHVPENVGWFAFEPKPGRVHARSKYDRGCVGLQEASMAELKGAALFQTGSSYVGKSGIDYRNPFDDTATWTFTNCAGGHYQLSFGYSLACTINSKGGCDRPMQVSVNGVVVDGFLSFPGSGSWSTVVEVAVSARLTTGVNRIELKAIGYSGPNVN
jgi:hypothetical protein